METVDENIIKKEEKIVMKEENIIKKKQLENENEKIKEILYKKTPFGLTQPAIERKQKSFEIIKSWKEKYSNTFQNHIKISDGKNY